MKHLNEFDSKANCMVGRVWKWPEQIESVSAVLGEFLSDLLSPASASSPFDLVLRV